MGGKQSIPQTAPEYKPQDTQEHIPQEVQRYKRFCPACKRETYDFKCCGQRTRRVNLQSTIGDNVQAVNMK